MEIIKEQNRVFIIKNNIIVAYCTFPRVRENIVNINHTVVDSSLRGQGVASNLLYAVVEVLIETNRKAIASCSYALSWFEKHKEFDYLLINK